MDLGESAPVEPFPVDVFPARVADFARAASASIGCPADFVGLPVLVVAGAAIGRSAALWLKPDDFATSSLYGLNVGGAASGDSPALDACVGPSGGSTWGSPPRSRRPGWHGTTTTPSG